MKKIIAILGHIGSGKDTAAKFFIETQQFSKISFADSLKDTLSSIFLWDRHLLEGTTAESRNWRNKSDEYWSSVLGFKVTPRIMMQQVGTELFRNHFSTNIWSHSLTLKVHKSKTNIVVADVRFIEEYDVLKSLGAVFIKIVKDIPYWEEIALKALDGDTDAINYLKSKNIHESEWRWLGLQPDHIIDNNLDILHLRQQLSNLNL